MARKANAAGAVCQASPQLTGITHVDLVLFWTNNIDYCAVNCTNTLSVLQFWCANILHMLLHLRQRKPVQTFLMQLCLQIFRFIFPFIAGGARFIRSSKNSRDKNQCKHF